MRYILSLTPVVVVIIVSITYLCITTVNRYVPTTKITVSEDNEKMYIDNLKSISKSNDIYVKCEVSVKSKWLMLMVVAASPNSRSYH
jgi:hypothetical protein